MGDFYSNTSDTNLVNDFLLQQPDLYIMKIEGESTGVLTFVTSGDDTLTDSSASYTIDALISTVGLNLYIEDDNGALAIDGKPLAAKISVSG